MPLLKIEVNLDEKNNSDKLFIYPGDDVIKITNKFCMKHKLKEEKKNMTKNIFTQNMLK